MNTIQLKFLIWTNQNEKSNLGFKMNQSLFKWELKTMEANFNCTNVNYPFKFSTAFGIQSENRSNIKHAWLEAVKC